MSEKKLTTEELTRQYEEAKKVLNDINAQLEERKREEQEELRLQEKMRRKEVDDAFDKYIELLKAYEKDYGTYILSRNLIDEFPWNMFWN